MKWLGLRHDAVGLDALNLRGRDPAGQQRILAKVL